MIEVIAQLEARAHRQRAHAAVAIELLVAQLKRFHHQPRNTLRLVVVFKPVLTGVIGVLQCQLRAVVALLLCPELRRALGVGAVVPTGDRHGVRLPPARALPAVDHVFRGGGICTAKADARLRVVGKDVIGICNDHAMHAQRIAVLGFVLEEIEQPFFGQQARGEIEVAFVVLRDDAAACVDRAVAQGPAPCGHEAPLALVVAKQAVDHLDDRHVLEQEAVLPMAQERKPRFDHEPIAYEPAVGAQLLETRHVAMERPQRAPALLRQQIQPHRLAEQLGRIDVSVVRQRREFQPEAACVDVLGRIQLLRQQHVRPQRRFQAQQPVGLGERRT